MGRRKEKHKIPGVDIEVCSCEQKIAYNFLHRAYINDYPKTPEGIYKEVLDGFDRDPGLKRFNAEYTAQCAKNSFERYMRSPRIMTDYEQCGKIIHS